MYFNESHWKHCERHAPKVERLETRIKDLEQQLNEAKQALFMFRQKIDGPSSDLFAFRKRLRIQNKPKV